MIVQSKRNAGSTGEGRTHVLSIPTAVAAHLPEYARWELIETADGLHFFYLGEGAGTGKQGRRKAEHPVPGFLQGRA